MLINIKELAKKGNTERLTEQFNLNGILGDRRDLLGASPLKADLQATYESGAVHVHGTLTMDVEVPCSRCLKHLHEHLQIPFDETFAKTDAGEQEEDEDDETIYVTEDKVDLKPFVLESMLLSLPYVPLCDEDCKGLCPVCGTNRNESPCGCKQEKIDPRLAGLADFFKD
ncbi:YceD family protein [Paenibacillus hamazuiensis]|uniref:YceD family protein n=1 Tax=Paenibacillus hamazuiensis TaxID=2936508 RepID=UPI00200C21FA|nr:DUF177 domain-containing protein [Paenibacillus hamazuiensis]